ncbi:MAG: aminotransferase class III-fold pyridoxal phosphate-dependent enzyme, partial [Phyllobacteriaceae bacterium]|nr:aminotransferase class III-fold pyridoxal phosphate-dependent enzyme [Phyllobacteriaceae bacterium]
MTSNAELLSRRTAAVPRGVSTATAVFADRAENAEIWDVEGKRYVDFAGGIAVLNTGHRHPKVMAAVEAQLARFTHTCFQVNAYESYVELAEKLNARAPFSGPAKTIFLTTGGEALENAVKIARAHTGRTAVITFTGAFHGRTMLTMAMTGKVAPYKKKF